MTVLTGKNLVFVKVEQGTSQKSGKPYCMVTLSADFENHTFGVNEAFDKTVLTTLKRGQLIDCAFSMENRFGNTQINILGISVPEAATKK